MPEDKDAKVTKGDVAKELVDEAVDNPLEKDGAHVVCDGEYVGTYETKADAEAFVAAHLEPQGKSANIVIVPAEAEPAKADSKADRPDYRA